MNIKKFFDLYWQKEEYRRWDDLRHHARSLKKEAYASIEEFGMSQIEPSEMQSADFRDSESSLPAKGRVLEIGPGMGQDTQFLARNGNEVYTIDISKECLKKVYESMSSSVHESTSTNQLTDSSTPQLFHILQMDATELGFKGESFDLLFANTVLMHLHRRKFFPEIQRILADGGKAIFIEPLRNNPFLFLYRMLFSKSREIQPDYLSLEEIQQYSSYFQKVETREFYLFSFLFFPFLHFSRLLKGKSNHVPDKPNRTFISSFFHLIERTDSAIIRQFPFTKRFCSFVVIECVK
jgi:SAM-dependent methyltransferase